MSGSTVEQTEALFSPLQVGDILVPNRIQMSALTRNRAPEAVPSDLMATYYGQRAKGGVGLIVSEATLITQQGTEWENMPGLWSSEQVEGWRKVTKAVHENGGFIYAQIMHVGRLAHPDAPQQRLAGTPVYGPSAIAAHGGKFKFLPGAPGYVTPSEIDDPTVFIEQFRQAAANAKEARFDGVELRGDSGHLVHQFLDYSSNKRTDHWGGSVENRCRFGLEVLKALISVFGQNVAVKLTPTGGTNDTGMPLQDTLDTFRYFISEAVKLKLSYIALVRYSPFNDYDLPDGTKRATQHDVLEAYGPLVVGTSTKLYVSGGLTPEEGARLVEEGKIDGAAYGHPLIFHPDFGKRVREGKPLDNKPNYTLMMSGESKDPATWGKGYTDYPTAE